MPNTYFCPQCERTVPAARWAPLMGGQAGFATCQCCADDHTLCGVDCVYDETIDSARAMAWRHNRDLVAVAERVMVAIAEAELRGAPPFTDVAVKDVELLALVVQRWAQTPAA